MTSVIDAKGCRIEIRSHEIEVRIRFRGSVTIPFARIQRVDVGAWRHVDTLEVVTPDGTYQWSLGARTIEAAEAIRAAILASRTSSEPARSAPTAASAVEQSPAAPPPAADEARQVATPGPRPRFIRVDLDDPGTLAGFVRTGVIWRTPQFAPDAIRAIESGAVKLSECHDVPSDIAAFLQRFGTPFSVAGPLANALPDAATAPSEAGGWLCSVHGATSLATRTGARTGRSYRSCEVPGCKEFERAPDAPVR